jgi:hypothetical protein
MKILCLLVALIMASPAFAFTPPTDAEKDACRHDALVLCTTADLLSAWLGDNTGIIACYRANRSKLSAGCRAVLRARGL